MYNFDEYKTVAEVKEKVREIAMNCFIEAFSKLCGEDCVSIIGSNEIAVCLGTRTLSDGTIGEVCFTSKAVAKDFDKRITESGKRFNAYERLVEADAYEDEVRKKKEEAEAKKKAKEAKIAKDKAARQKKGEDSE